MSEVDRDSMVVLQQLVGEWQRQTFGEPSPLGVQGQMKKLEKESHELALALVGAEYSGGAAVEEELADNLILLLGMADALSIDAAYHVRRKLAINRARKWPSLAQQTPGQPVQHIEESL